jgi:hypothetical protein
MLNRYHHGPGRTRRHQQSGRGFACAAVRDTWLAVQAILVTASLSLGFLAAALAALLAAKPRR